MKNSRRLGKDWRKEHPFAGPGRCGCVTRGSTSALASSVPGPGSPQPDVFLELMMKEGHPHIESQDLKLFPSYLLQILVGQFLEVAIIFLKTSTVAQRGLKKALERGELRGPSLTKIEGKGCL